MTRKKESKGENAIRSVVDDYEALRNAFAYAKQHLNDIRSLLVPVLGEAVTGDKGAVELVERVTRKVKALEKELEAAVAERDHLRGLLDAEDEYDDSSPLDRVLVAIGVAAEKAAASNILPDDRDRYLRSAEGLSKVAVRLLKALEGAGR